MVIKIEAIKRELGKKSDRKDLRKAGKIPAIMYGEGKPGINITLDATDFMKAYKRSIGEMAIFNIELDGETHRTIIKDKQIHPVRRDVLHVDFILLHPGHEITLPVPIKFVGEPAGVKEGGILDIIERNINISVLPKDIPEDIQIDISGLKIGDSLHVADIKIDNAKIIDAEESTIVVVHDMNRGEEATEESEEAAE